MKPRRNPPYPLDRLDKLSLRNYLFPVNIIRRTQDIDADTDARLREMASKRGQALR